LPGVRTVVNDSKDGLLVKPNDVADLAAKIDQILSLLPETRSDMGILGREKVIKKYTWELACDRLEEIYTKVYQ
jgi:glycosyltransferase involved in cell wall biosynthesis